MDRISGAGYVLDPSGHRVFQDINQAAGISGTDVVALWLTGVQESILAVVGAATSPALTPTDADNTQMLQAIRQIAAAVLAANIASFFPTTSNSVKLPGGIIFQFFEMNVPAEETNTYNFPTAFPNNAYLVIGGVGAGISTTQANPAGANPISKSQFSVTLPSSVAGSAGVWFIAVGN